MSEQPRPPTSRLAPPPVFRNFSGSRWQLSSREPAGADSDRLAATPGRAGWSRRRVLAALLGTALPTALGAGALAGCAAAGDGGEPGRTLSAEPGGGPEASSTDAGAGASLSGATAEVIADGKQALERLLAGNARFVAAQEQALDEGIARRIAVSKGQDPFATILGCIDSRVPIELVFDQGLGDLVVVRSAGEALDHSVVGSVEFGVAELHTPLLMVLGHQRCGALTAAMNAVDSAHRTADHGEIDYVVEALAPAVQGATGKPGDRLTNAIRTNVDLTLAKLRQSPVIAPLVKAGKLELAGAYYELDTGRVVLS